MMMMIIVIILLIYVDLHKYHKSEIFITYSFLLCFSQRTKLHRKWWTY